MKSLNFLLVFFLLLFACSNDVVDDFTESEKDDPNNEIVNTANFEGKMTGISLESPPDEFPGYYLDSLSLVNAEWMAISPFGFSFNNSAEVQFNSQWQWWGETVEGASIIADYAVERDIQVMMKPQVWINNGWVGQYDLETEEEWQIWENTYREFVLAFAQVAAEKDLPLFCIGTEYKIAAVEREDYWRSLIDTIRTFYDGELTYAANWDNYQNIAFWDQLDYIGVDSYFPLVEDKTPEVEPMVEAWQPLVATLKAFSESFDKPIIFTEYGYMSIDYTAWHNWENEANADQLEVNLSGQTCAFEAFFQALWAEDWFKGGFIWKWEPDHVNAGGETNKRYTPQNKPAQEVIKNWYGL